MRLKIPITGTVVDFDPDVYKLDGIGISGDPNDPVRLIGIDLGGVAWRLINIDLENDLAEVEVEAPEQITEPRLDANSKPVKDEPLYIQRPTTATGKEQILNYAQSVVNSFKSKTIDEVYASAREKRLVKSESVMGKYRKAK